MSKPQWFSCVLGVERPDSVETHHRTLPLDPQDRYNDINLRFDKAASVSSLADIFA